MAYRITLLCLAVGLVTPGFAADPPKKYALLIAVTRYDHASMNEPRPITGTSTLVSVYRGPNSLWPSCPFTVCLSSSFPF
jgi:hypothetical protein